MYKKMRNVKRVEKSQKSVGEGWGPVGIIQRRGELNRATEKQNQKRVGVPFPRTSENQEIYILYYRVPLF